jgi:hypothetical protein
VPTDPHSRLSYGTCLHLTIKNRLIKMTNPHFFYNLGANLICGVGTPIAAVTANPADFSALDRATDRSRLLQSNYNDELCFHNHVGL